MTSCRNAKRHARRGLSSMNACDASPTFPTPSSGKLLACRIPLGSLSSWLALTSFWSTCANFDQRRPSCAFGERKPVPIWRPQSSLHFLVSEAHSQTQTPSNPQRNWDSWILVEGPSNRYLVAFSVGTIGKLDGTRSVGRSRGPAKSRRRRSSQAATLRS